MKHLYLFILLFLCIEQLLAQSKGMVAISKQLPAGTEHRLALVVGNKDYYNPEAILKNPINDAQAMRNTLQKLGFDVLYYTNLDRISFEKAVDDFGAKLNKYDVGLFYYSGHGIQAQGENYLVPVDANSIGTEAVANYTCVNVGRVLGLMEGSKAETNLVFLDACRNNPFKKSWGSKGEAQRGFAIPRNPPGTCVVYATSAASTADDNVASKNGLFTENLLQFLSKPNMSLSSILNETRKEVYRKSNQAQLPEDYVKLLGDFYFLVSSDNQPVKPQKDLLPYEPEMVFVQGGTFKMGTNVDNTTHGVTLTDYYIGIYEITQKQWKAVMGNIPAGIPSCENCPIGGVNWNDTQMYLQKLNELTGKNYRLPTEAEWEYAAGGGQKSNGFIHAGSNTVESVGWIDSNSGNKLHEVGRKQPNELGLYDMNGNVWEWCNDWYGAYNNLSHNPTGPNNGTSRVLRGGSWVNNFQLCRVASRGSNNPNERYINFGLRVVLTP